MSTALCSSCSSTHGALVAEQCHRLHLCWFIGDTKSVTKVRWAREQRQTLRREDFMRVPLDFGQLSFSRVFTEGFGPRAHADRALAQA